MFFSSRAAKGLSNNETFELAPLTCFVGLSEGGVASWGIALKLLAVVSRRIYPWWMERLTTLAARQDPRVREAD